MTVEELLEKVQVDPESPGNDLLESTQSATFPNDTVMQLIGGILKDDACQRWLFGARSAGLLVDEHASVRGLGLSSPFGTCSSPACACGHGRATGRGSPPASSAVCIRIRRSHSAGPAG